MTHAKDTLSPDTTIITSNIKTEQTDVPVSKEPVSLEELATDDANASNSELNHKVEKVAKNLDMSKDEMIEEISRLKTSISFLSSNIRDTRNVVENYDSENQYLQEFVGTLMKNNEH